LIEKLKYLMIMETNILIIVIVFVIISAILAVILIKNYKDMKEYLKMMNAESDLSKLEDLKEEEDK
jgi:Tfp pilus assembly protein PilE